MNWRRHFKTAKMVKMAKMAKIGLQFISLITPTSLELQKSL